MTTSSTDPVPIREEELLALERTYASSRAAADIHRLVEEIRRLRAVTERLRVVPPAENLAEFVRRSPLAEAVAAGEFELPERIAEQARDVKDHG